MTKKLPLMLIVLVLGACGTQLVLVEPGAHTIDDRYTVTSEIAWNEVKEDEAVVWTNDGFALETIRFYAGLDEGDTLFEWADEEEDNHYPLYQADMQASEVAEYVAHSLETLGFQEVTVSGLRPTEFGSRSGYRFEMEMLTAEGMDVDALAVGASDDDGLDLILYMGERHYYFPKYRDAVEKILISITLDT